MYEAQKIIIIGAGISGLSVAYHLQKQAPDADITVLEQESRPGGKAWTLREQGFQLEIGPNGFLDNKPSTLDVCRGLGLQSRLLEAHGSSKNRYLFLGIGLAKLPNGFGELLRSGLLTWPSKIGFILERFRRQASHLRDESIRAFIERRASREVADVFGDALVTGIYAGDPRLLSLPACFPRIAAFEKQYGSVIKGFIKSAQARRRKAKAHAVAYPSATKMWSFQEGLRFLSESLAQSLSQPPIYGVDVRRLEPPATPHSFWLVGTEGQNHWQADAVVLTCPAHQQTGLLAKVDEALSAEVADIPYNSVAVVGLGYRQADVPIALDGFGFIAPQNTRRDLLGVQWCSSLFPGRAPEGAVLLRAMCGGWNRPEMVGWSDDRLLSALRVELRLAMNIVAAPIYQKIIRWQRAIPQYHVGHLDRLQRIDKIAGRYPGLFLGGNAYRGVALNDCTEQGEVLARQVAHYLDSRNLGTSAQAAALSTP